MLASSNISALTCLLRCSSRRFIRPAASVMRSSYSTQTQENLQVPNADDASKIYSEKLTNIVSEISKLTILEVSDLNELLKKTLNISEAPVMAMGMAPAAAKVEEEDEDAGTIQQTNFTLKITKFDETKKVALIKYMKSIMEEMNLVQAKKFIEALPALVRKDVPKEEAEKLKEELIAVGAECEIE